MQQSVAQVIVQEAIDLLVRHPDMPAREIVLRAIARHRQAGQDFESVDPAEPDRPHPAYSDELYPPAPFAEILRRAYSPGLDPREAALMTLLEWPQPEHQAECFTLRIDTVTQRWKREVVKPFLAELNEP